MTARSTLPPADRPTIRLFNPATDRTAGDDRQHRLRQQWRLRDAFEQLLLPRLQQAEAAPGTISEYTRALKHWEQCTQNPPVWAISDTTLDAFFQVYQPGSKATRNKTWRHLRPILRACTARGPGNPRGMTEDPLLQHVPYAETAPEPNGSARLMPRELLGQTYEKSEIAVWPQLPGLAPAVVWRLLWVMYATYGFRRRELLRLERSAIHLQPECPNPRWASISSPHGWLEYVPGKTRRYKPDPLLLPLTATARRHLDAVLQAAPPADGRLLRLPVNGSRLQNTRRDIQHAAGIKEPYTFRELRTYAATAWNSLYPGLGEHVTGHAPRGVHARFYDQWLGRLVDLAPELPEPDAFRNGALLDCRERQGRLF